jgi:DNA-binding PadR family transcriptional regulator
VAVHAGALESPCLGLRRSAGRLGVVAAAALAMAGRGRGRHGPRFVRGGGFGPLFFGPGGFPRGPRARRGDVRTAALLLLAEGPLNGYQIMQEIEQRSNGAWRPSPGSVYPALAQLEDEGLVSTEELRDRRTYVLTDAGRAWIDARRGELAPPWEEMTRSVDDDAGPLFRELRRLAMAVAQIGQFGSANQVGKARDIVAEARRALHAVLAEDDVDD